MVVMNRQIVKNVSYAALQSNSLLDGINKILLLIDNCTSLDCPVDCHNLPSGPICTCKFGFKYNPRTNKCIDVNECEVYGICSQMCQNTNGSHQCTCIDKFSIDKDKQTCKSQSGQILYYATKKSIHAFNINEQRHISIMDGIKNVFSIDIDNNDLYFVQMQSKSDGISRIGKILTLEQRLIVLKEFISSGRCDIKVDWITKNLYIVDESNQRIFVCTNDGTHCEKLNFDVKISPKKLVLDPRNGLMYWSDYRKIYRSNMDGSNVVEFAKNQTGDPYFMYLDWPNERLYWVDFDDFRGYRSIETNGKNYLVNFTKFINSNIIEL